MLKRVTHDLWTVEHDLFSMGLHFPGRMTVVRLSDGGLWLHSPVPIDDETAAELAELGPVRHIVAPNLFHHLHLGPVIERYPEAEVWGVPGLAKKRADLTFTGTLEDAAPAGWGPDLEMVPFTAMPKVNEMAFLHGPSRTLLVTDLFMNVHACRGLMSKLVYWLEGGYRRLGVPRLFKLLVKDKAAAAASAARLVAFQPERVIMAHGEIVTEDAATRAEAALQAFRPSPQLVATV